MTCQRSVMLNIYNIKIFLKNRKLGICSRYLNSGLDHCIFGPVRFALQKMMKMELSLS